MSCNAEEILAVLTPEQRAVLAPHLERFHRARQEAADAEAVIHVAVRAFWPDLVGEGVKFDTNRGVLWRLKP